MNEIMNKDVREIEEFIKNPGEKELRYINRLVVEKIKLLVQQRSIDQMMKFNIGERVSFNASDSMKRSGVIIRINKKTISIDAQDGGYWNVAPGLLSHE